MRVMRAVRSHSAFSWLTMCGRGLALATLWCALLAASAVAADEDDYATRNPAIPAGEERLIAAMLGRGTLVRDCKLISGGVEYTVIVATYNCPHGQVTIELGHPQDATGPFTPTEQFAITVQSGSPPPGFQDDFLSRIRSRENDFVWIWPENAPVQGVDAGDDGAE